MEGLSQTGSGAVEFEGVGIWVTERVESKEVSVPNSCSRNGADEQVAACPTVRDRNCLLSSWVFFLVRIGGLVIDDDVSNALTSTVSESGRVSEEIQQISWCCKCVVPAFHLSYWGDLQSELR